VELGDGGIAGVGGVGITLDLAQLVEYRYPVQV